MAPHVDARDEQDDVVDIPQSGGCEGFFELSILRAQGNVRIALLILLLVVALSSPAYLASKLTLYTALIVGVFLTLWTRYAARWGELRARGHLRTAAGVVLLGEYAWLALFVHGTGGLVSPFASLLLLPVLFASAFFCLLNVAVALSTGLIVVTFGLFALSPGTRSAPGVVWHLTGMLIAVIAVAWGAYGLCVVLERERRTNEMVVRHLSEGVLLIDGLGWIRLYNRQMARFFGIPPETLLTLNTRHIHKEPDLVELGEILHDVLNPESYDPRNVRDVTIHRPDPVELRVITMRLSGTSDQSMGWLVVCQDVTELKAMVRMREDGVRFLSHEIRSPLTTFKMVSSVFAELAEQLSDSSSAHLIEVVDNEADRMLRLVGQFLDVAALDQGTYKLDTGDVNVRELIETAASTLRIRAEAKQVEVTDECDANVAVIQGDSGALETCLHNLCDNALKYTDKGGKISLSAHMNGDHVQIAVADNGHGIPEQMHEEIFGEFIQAHQDGGNGSTVSRGVGLGLYLVRSLVELQGGSIELESEDGMGSVFTISLPVAGHVRRPV